MYFDSILAVSDFTALSAHALERAALLARQHQTTLRLVHFADGPKTYLADPIARLGQRARQLARRHGPSRSAGGAITGPPADPPPAAPAS